MGELLVAEILDDLHLCLERDRGCAARSEPDVLRDGSPASSPGPPTAIVSAGSRFIDGEPMNVATKMFAGRV